MYISGMFQKQSCAGDEILSYRILANKYRSLHQIYAGSRSTVFSICFRNERKNVDIRAIKMQSSEGTEDLIRNEINVYRLLTSDENEKEANLGFPIIYETEVQKGKSYIVMELCGPSLAQLLKLCGGKMSKKTVTLIGLQLMDRMEFLHEKKLLYQNFCPENFLVGLGNQSMMIKMIDFSECQSYKSKKNVHVLYKPKISEISPHFSSITSQLNIQTSRKDDIESLLYLLVYLQKGKLPWSQVEGLSIKEVQQETLAMKKRISPESLMKSLSIEYIDMMYYAKTLNFYQKPNYNFMRKKLWMALLQTDYENLSKNIICYDWDVREDLDYDIYRQNPKIRKDKGQGQGDEEEDEEDSEQKEVESQILLDQNHQDLI